MFRRASATGKRSPVSLEGGGGGTTSSSRLRIPKVMKSFPAAESLEDEEEMLDSSSPAVETNGTLRS